MERLLEEFLADRLLLRLDDSLRSGERCMLAVVEVLRGASMFSRDGRCCALGWLFGLDLCCAAGAAFSWIVERIVGSSSDMKLSRSILRSICRIRSFDGMNLEDCVRGNVIGTGASSASKTMIASFNFFSESVWRGSTLMGAASILPTLTLEGLAASDGLTARDGPVELGLCLDRLNGLRRLFVLVPGWTWRSTFSLLSLSCRRLERCQDAMNVRGVGCDSTFRVTLGGAIFNCSFRVTADLCASWVTRRCLDESLDSSESVSLRPSKLEPVFKSKLYMFASISTEASELSGNVLATGAGSWADALVLLRPWLLVKKLNAFCNMAELSSCLDSSETTYLLAVFRPGKLGFFNILISCSLSSDEVSQMKFILHPGSAAAAAAVLVPDRLPAFRELRKRSFPKQEGDACRVSAPPPPPYQYDVVFVSPSVPYVHWDIVLVADPPLA
jgi:hypothetical protein